MRRPHVYERSAPRTGRQELDKQAARISAARMTAAQLSNLVEKAKGAGLLTLADLLEQARQEAETAAAS